MKVSKIILVSTAGATIALMLISLLVLRNDIYTMQKKNGYANRFKKVKVENFKSINVSSNWIINIYQGDLKVELAIENGDFLKPAIVMQDGQLFFKIEGNRVPDSTVVAHARITVPNLIRIQAESGSKIIMKDFKSDSLNVILNGGDFVGSKNKIKFISFKTSDNASVKHSDNEIDSME